MGVQACAVHDVHGCALSYAVGIMIRVRMLNA